MRFIPNFVARKHGHEEIQYAHPLLKDILQNTYGIMVYQEQIIQTAQVMAGYTLGSADLLRRAMGKKKANEMAKQREVFVQGAQEKHGIGKPKALEVFAVMEKFAQYGFNRSHSAAYSLLAYQTAYLKAHYTAEYMASVLTHNQNDIDKITFFMGECKRQGIPVLGPDVNESGATFDVNSARQVRFGLGAIKGVGDAAVEEIIRDRSQLGHFQTLFSFAERVGLKAVNKKTFESLAMAGAFDSFPHYHRRQYLYSDDQGISLIEKAIVYGQQRQHEKASSQQSLFATIEGQTKVLDQLPEVASCEPYDKQDMLRMEKEVVGFYISGHPLDQYRIELESFCNCHTQNVLALREGEARLAGIITDAKTRQSKHGRPFGVFTVEDYEGTLTLSLFGEDYLKNQHMLKEATFVYIIGPVVERYRHAGIWELKPRKLSLLGEIRAKMGKSLLIHLAVQHINMDLVNQLEKILIRYPGTCPIVLHLTSSEESIQLRCRSRSYQADPSNAFFESIRAISGVTCWLQTK